MDLDVFRRNLKHLIDARNLTVQSFSDKIGIKSPTIYRYINGDRTPDVTYVAKICEFFSVSMDWMLGLSGADGSAMPEEVQDVARRYMLASPDDREVVQAVLKRYSRSPEKSE